MAQTEPKCTTRKTLARFSTAVGTRRPRGTRLSHMEPEREKREQVKGVIDPEVMREWRRTCTDNAVSQNEALERILRWYVQQDRTTQQLVLDVIPAALRPAAANHVIRALVDWGVRSSDVGQQPPSAEMDRLREAATLYHVTLPPVRRPDGSVEQITRSYEIRDRSRRTDEPGESDQSGGNRPVNGGSKQGAA